MRIVSQRVVLAVVVLSLVSVPSLAFGPAQQIGKPPLDVRLPAGDAARAGWVMREPAPLQRAAAEALRAAVPGVTLRWDGLSGAPKWIGAPAGATLSAPLAGTPEEAARAFLQANAALYGLTGREVEQLRHVGTIPGGDGGSNVHFAQTVSGLDVVDAAVRVSLDPRNAVTSTAATLFSGLQLRVVVAVGATDAVARAVQDVYPDRVFTGSSPTRSDSVDSRTSFAEAEFARPIGARLVVFPGQDEPRVAWEIRAAEPSLATDYLLLVDVLDGSLLLRQNLTRYADARVVAPAVPDPKGEQYESPQYVLKTVPSATPQSPAGWISGSGTVLAGNNATAHPASWTQPSPGEPGATYDYPFNTSESSLVNAWWLVNDAHDRFYALGFNEASWNYQQDNFGLGGTGGDAVRVVQHIGSARDWVGFFDPISVDGGVSTLAVTWTIMGFDGDHDGYPENGGDRSGGFDPTLVYHEYTHGVTTRLTGGGTNPLCLRQTQSAALDEGWADLMAASFAATSIHDPYLWEASAMTRSVRHDLDYADFCKIAHSGGCEIHADGMIWSGALWELRDTLRALDPAGGVETLERLVVEGMKRSACQADYLDARDAILQADSALFGSAHVKPIWNVFAARGMGQDASTTGGTDTAPHAGYVVPPAHVCSAPASPLLTSAAPAGDNMIRVTFTAPGAAAVEIWRDDLDNPVDVLQRIAFATSTSPYDDTTVEGGRNYRYQLVALGGGGTVCRSAASTPSDAVATGSCDAFPVFDPDLVITSDNPSCALMLSWSPALPGCPGRTDPVIYNIYRAAAPGFDPGNYLLIGRTSATSFQDTPPQDGRSWYYLVLAQHGTQDDPVDARDRGSSQVMRWVTRVPAPGRATARVWGFEAGAAGWTADNGTDTTGGWVLVDPNPTRYEGRWFAPRDAASGSMAWVTGDAGGPSDVAAYDCNAKNVLRSPTWDGTGGATILSFDYWIAMGRLDIDIRNGVQTVTTTLSPGYSMVQAFDTDPAHGWQRAELDLGALIEPTATMSVWFRARPHVYVAEFGIDNVRVERATVCGRSALRLSSVGVDDTPAGWGNGNHVLEPGETALLSVTVVNDGSVAASAPVGVLRSSLPGLLLHEATATFSDVAPGASVSSNGPGFTVTMPPSFSCENTALFEFEFRDTTGTLATATWNAEFGRSVPETVFADTFQTDKGWVAGGSAGKGKWQRGDPVGTTTGGKQANPETDSPNDAGAQCYVTENGPVGGSATANDVDGTTVDLLSPLLNLEGYKRARLFYDLWYFDDSTSTPSWDYGEIMAYPEDGLSHQIEWQGWYAQYDPTGGWIPREENLTDWTPLVANSRVRFRGVDSVSDSVVEMGVDNVRIEGDRQVCDALGVTKAPNGIGDTLLVGKSVTLATLAWTASPVDPDHDGAAYYQIFVSSVPSGGFRGTDTAAATTTSRSLAPVTEFYTITAVNVAGTSGDEPTP